MKGKSKYIVLIALIIVFVAAFILIYLMHNKSSYDDYVNELNEEKLDSTLYGDIAVDDFSEDLSELEAYDRLALISSNTSSDGVKRELYEGYIGQDMYVILVEYTEQGILVTPQLQFVD